MTTGGGGTNVGRRRPTDADAMPENTGGAEEAAVRGGQLFGHLVGRGGGNSTGSGGYGSADDSEILFHEGISREDSGWSELAFGLELSGVGALLKRDKAEEPFISSHLLKSVSCLSFPRLTHFVARFEL